MFIRCLYIIYFHTIRLLCSRKQFPKNLRPTFDNLTHTLNFSIIILLPKGLTFRKLALLSPSDESGKPSLLGTSAISKYNITVRKSSRKNNKSPKAIYSDLLHYWLKHEPMVHKQYSIHISYLGTVFKYRPNFQIFPYILMWLTLRKNKLSELQFILLLNMKKIISYNNY
jgi:hypothetical protein